MLVMLVVTLAMLGLCELLGLTAALEASLQRGHASLREAAGVSRESSERVLIVAGDRATTAAWGPPPWPEARRAQLWRTVEAGGPAAMLELGHPPMFLGSTPSRSQLVRGTELVPDERLRELESHGVLPAIPARLPIEWLTPSARLPIVSAAEVESGRIPARTFAGRVVVFGLTDPDQALALATPVGPLRLVEIEAHALAGLGDRRIPIELAAPWSLLGCVLVAITLVGLRERFGPKVWALALLLGVPALLIVDVGLVELGHVRIGVARVVSTVLVLAGGSAIVELLATLAAIERLRTWVQGELGHVDAPTAADDQRFWTTLATAGLARVQAIAGPSASVSLLERDLDTRALEVRASAGLEPRDHAALATRDPGQGGSAIWSASLTGRARFAQLLASARETKSLIVPLPKPAPGLLLVHLPIAAELAGADVSALEQLARELAATIGWRRELARLRLAVGSSQASAQLDAVAASVRLLRDRARVETGVGGSGLGERDEVQP